MRDLIVQVFVEYAQVVSTTFVLAAVRCLELRWRESKWKKKLDDIKKANGLSD